MLRAALVATTLALAGTFAFAQSDVAEKALQPGMGFCLELAKASDVNRDGMVTRDEFMKMVDARFTKKDRAGKNALTHQQAAELLHSFSGYSPL